MGCIQQLLVLLKRLQNCNRTTTLFTQTQHDIIEIISTNDVSEIISVLEKNTTEKNTLPLGKLVIDNHYNITITNYDIELQFAHLTKAIYILFLLHPNGIHLKEFKNYEQELFNIYKNISYQTSLTKKKEAVNKVISSKNNEIYRHLSRIKREIYNKLPQEIADTYCILGNKNEVKKIQLPQQLKEIKVCNVADLTNERN